jgi:Flp pilus assembly protein TadG
MNPSTGRFFKPETTMFGPGKLRFTKAFWRQESGGVTIEAVLWMPVFVALLCLVADASLIFGRQAEVLRVVQDANRAMSVGRFSSDGELDATDVTEAYIKDRISGLAPNATVDTTVTSGVIRTVVTIPSSDLTANTPIGFLDALTIEVAAEHLMEA